MATATDRVAATIDRHAASKDLVVLGSGALVQSLIGRDLIDEYTLLIHRWYWVRGAACSPITHSPHCGSPAA